MAGTRSDLSTNRMAAVVSSQWILSFLLMLAVLVAFWPALRGGFIWDDNGHITFNETLHSFNGLRDIWFKPGATQQYYPLSFTVFWVDYHLWGLNPLGYHLQNVLMHGLAAVILWQVLKRLRAPGAGVAAAIFALHPVNVMSVAWPTELKNTLSFVLVLGAGWAYLRFAGLGIYNVPGNRGKSAVAAPAWPFYILSLFLFLLAMCAKTAVSFLPATLFLLLWWQRDRLRFRELWPLLPMLGIIMAMGRMTFYVEHHSAGASGPEFDVDWMRRLLISGRSFWFYLGKLFFPYQLTFIYPRWQVDPGIWWQWLFPPATAGLLGGLWLMRGRIGKGAFVALAHFYISTSLLILLVVLFMTRYSFVSDHWVYFGGVGVMALAAAGIATALRQRTVLKSACIGSLLLVLGVLTWRQCGMYANIETLWRTTIQRNPGSWMPHNELGVVLLNSGRTDAALAEFQKAVEINPDLAEAHFNLGVALSRSGRNEEAMTQYQAALKLNPDFADMQNKFGLFLWQTGRNDEAITHFRAATQLKPDDAEAWFNLGNSLVQIGQIKEAIASYEKAVAADPHYLQAQNNLASVLATCPDDSLRDGRRAVQVAQSANQFTDGGNPIILGTLASAYAEAGQFPEAIATARRALELANGQNNTGLSTTLQLQLGYYEKGLPFRNVNMINRAPDEPLK
jgi:protein O-mannosyl-transferase